MANPIIISQCCPTQPEGTPTQGSCGDTLQVQTDCNALKAWDGVKTAQYTLSATVDTTNNRGEWKMTVNGSGDLQASGVQIDACIDLEDTVYGGGTADVHITFHYQGEQDQDSDYNTNVSITLSSYFVATEGGNSANDCCSSTIWWNYPKVEAAGLPFDICNPSVWGGGNDEGSSSSCQGSGSSSWTLDDTGSWTYQAQFSCSGGNGSGYGVTSQSGTISLTFSPGTTPCSSGITGGFTGTQGDNSNPGANTGGASYTA